MSALTLFQVEWMIMLCYVINKPYKISGEIFFVVYV